MATQGSGNIAAVAPGVAEALIATAAALAVAIPAVFGYNIFANRVNRFDGELEGFGSELIALMVREGQDLARWRTRRRERTPLNAEINVVSLIDVMMLLHGDLHDHRADDAGRRRRQASEGRRVRSSRRAVWS